METNKTIGCLFNRYTWIVVHWKFMDYFKENWNFGRKLEIWYSIAALVTRIFILCTYQIFCSFLNNQCHQNISSVMSPEAKSIRNNRMASNKHIWTAKWKQKSRKSLNLKHFFYRTTIEWNNQRFQKDTTYSASKLLYNITFTHSQ